MDTLKEDVRAALLQHARDHPEEQGKVGDALLALDTRVLGFDEQRSLAGSLGMPRLLLSYLKPGVAMTEERLQQLVTDAVQQAIRPQESVEPKAFSKVDSTEAEQLLQQLGILEVDGRALEPIQLPRDTPVCSDFDFAQFRDENEGTPALLKHHETQLTKLGVKFGRNGYQVFDLHTMPSLYRITATPNAYRGNIDGCVAPYGLAAASAALQCRVAYEHKQSADQKKTFRDTHPQEAFGPGCDTGTVRFAAACKGQAIAATLGAYAYNAFPLVFDLTDGKVHHVLRIRGNELMEWTDLSSTQAYYLQAQLLNDAQYSTLLTSRSLALEAIPEELQQPMKKLRSLRPSSALKEQLDSIVPELAAEEKLHVTHALINEWACRSQLAMPAAVQAMFS